jgi:Short C-terminal domain
MPEPIEATESPPESPADPSPSSGAPAQRQRRLLVNAIFACAVVVGVFAVLAVWVHRQVLDTNNWTNTSSQVLADPKVQTALGSLLVNELFSSVDVAGELKSVLPSQVSGLAAPAAAGLRSLAIQVAPQVLSTGVVQKAWRQANRTAQLELVRILNGGHRTITTNNGVVSLQLHPLLTQLAAQLGLQQQLASVQSQLEGSTGTAARGTVQQKLGVKIPPPSGSIVILRSSQLKTAQNVVKAIKGLAVVLPTIAFLLFILAVWLAEGWRRVAVRTTGWCLIAVGLIVVIARRVLGDALVSSLVNVPSNKPAVHQVFNIGTSLLYDAAIALITYGVAIVIATWIAGPTRPAHTLRRALAPSLREHVAYVYAVAGLALLLLVVWGPFPSTRQPLPVIGIAILLVLGIRALRRMTAQEFPEARMGDLAHAVRDWFSSRRQSLLAGFAGTRPNAGPAGEGEQRISALERLADLHHRGALTDEEFRAQKATLLEPSAPADHAGSAG